MPFKNTRVQQQKSVCVSLSNDSLITCGFNGENRSPLVKRDLDRCDVPLVPEDFASRIIMNINSPISQSAMDSIKFSLDNRGLPSKKKKGVSSRIDLHSQDKSPKTIASFRRVLTITYYLTGRNRRICLGQLESRKQSFVAA